MFTYHNDTQESDIEVLTRDPLGYVHFSNQPTEDIHGASIPGSTFNISVPGLGKPTGVWNTFRVDWIPGHTVWYVDSNEIVRSQFNVPIVDSTVTINMWSSGSPWSGTMAIGNSAELEIQWVEMIYNTSSGGEVGSQGSICSVEGEVGTPVALAAPTVSSGCAWGVHPDKVILCSSVVVVFLMVFR
jgi:hypothetical protein